MIGETGDVSLRLVPAGGDVVDGGERRLGPPLPRQHLAQQHQRPGRLAGGKRAVAAGHGFPLAEVQRGRDRPARLLLADQERPDAPHHVVVDRVAGRPAPQRQAGQEEAVGAGRPGRAPARPRPPNPSPRLQAVEHVAVPDIGGFQIPPLTGGRVHLIERHRHPGMPGRVVARVDSVSVSRS